MTLLVKYLIFGLTIMVNPQSLKGMLAASIAFLGLGFCSPPAPAVELKKIITQDQAVCLAQNMYFEARNQSWRGIIAVGMVTLNRVSDNRFPDVLCDVVKQGPTSKWWFKTKGKIVPIRHKCQFSWYCDGKSDKIPKFDIELYNAIFLKAVRMIGAYNWGSLDDMTKGSTHYHADYVYPAWREQKTKMITIGNHIFYKWEESK